MCERKVCSICFREPAKIHGQCYACYNSVKTIRQNSKRAEPVKYLTYRGYVVGLYSVGNGNLRAKSLNRSADRLPKGRTINLNVWCEGYTRGKIKEFKACVLSLSEPIVKYAKGV